MERIFISWVASSTRSHQVAEICDAKEFYVRYLQKKPLIYTFLRYLVASFHTVLILYRTKPKIVFVMNLPVFLPMVVFLYTRIRKCHYVIDSHSTMFNRGVWRRFIPIMKIVYRNAFLNIAQNNYDNAVFESWNVRTVPMFNDVSDYDTHEKIKLSTKNNIVVIVSYSPDEPIHEVLLAAKALTDVHFYLTGSLEAAKRFGIEDVPGNVTLTDFLPRDDFISLIKSTDGVMVLVNDDNTMQSGGWEALSCGTPLILSNWSLLRETFPRGAVYVENTKFDIQKGVVKFFENKDVLKDEILELKKEKARLRIKEIEDVKIALEYRH